jgi:hypothetical protein
MICGFSRFLVNVAQKRAQSGLSLSLTSSSLGRSQRQRWIGIRAVTLPTRCERGYRRGVDICLWLRHPPPPEGTVTRGCPPDRQEASSIPGNSAAEFKCGHRQNSQALSLTADHQYPWSSGGLSRRFTLVILRVTSKRTLGIH